MYGLKEILIAVGAFAGVVALALTASVLMLLWDKHRDGKGFDERQMMHRGRGTVLGFWAMVIFDFVVLIWDGMEPGFWNGQWIAMLSILLGGTLSVTYFMLTDSWAKFNEKTWWVGPCFLLSGAAQFLNFKRLNEDLLILVQMGKETPQSKHFMFLLCGLCMIYYGLLHMVCHWWHNRE